MLVGSCGVAFFSAGWWRPGFRCCSANLVLSASSSGLVRCVEVTLCYKKIWNVSLKITCICIIFCIMIHHILTLYVIFLGGTGLFRFRFM